MKRQIPLWFTAFFFILLSVGLTYAGVPTPPTITSFSPASGVIGTSVTITGTNFNATADQNIVFFGATKATVTAASTTSLTVIVPTGATYQPISVLNLATTLMAYSAAPFRVTFAGGAIADNSFSAAVSFPTTGKNFYSRIGDLDGDGKPDLVVANWNNGSGNTISVFRNISSSGIITSSSFESKVDFTTGTNPMDISIGDLDGDGKPDLVVTTRNFDGNSISLLRNTATSGIIDGSSFESKVDFLNGLNAWAVDIGDLDGDGKSDLVVTYQASNNISVLRNTTSVGSFNSGSFAPKVDFATGNGSNSQPYDVAIKDLDGDNKPELVVSNSEAGTISILRNTASSGNITNSSFDAKVNFITGSNPSSSNWGMDIGDLDGDDKPDLVVVNLQDNSISVFRNTASSGGFTSSSFESKVDFATSVPTNVKIGDLDGDGKPDLVVSSSYSMSVFRNTASIGSITSSSFASNKVYYVGDVSRSLSIGDLDGDSKPDLVVTNTSSNNIYVSRNNPKFPQGSLSVNGPFCTSGTGKLTFTATEGTGPFTVIYNDGTAQRTVTNVVSGTAFNVFTNPVTSTTTYTLVSVADANSALRTSEFTVGSATITINPAVVVPTPQANTQILLGGSVTLTATGCSGVNDVLKWYQSSDNDLVSMPISPLSTTNYYAKCESTLNGITCLSANSIEVTVTVISRIYVDIAKIAAPLQDGNSWATAYGSLQAGLDAATPGRDVWVAKGTYKPTTTTTRTIYFNMPNNIAVYGGFAGTEDNLVDRNFKINATILSGDIGTQNLMDDNSYHVVTFSGSSNSTMLDGFTITGGNASFDPKVNVLPLTNSNSLTNPTNGVPNQTGGGILIDNAGKPIITNCIINKNTALFGGGIFCLDSSTPSIQACNISNNEATFGGAIYAYNASNFTMKNVLMAANRGIGGVYNNTSNPTLTNCTIASNGGYNGGIFNLASQPVVKNSILWGNVGPFNDAQSIISYSIVQGGYSGIGNLTVDPKFINPAPFEPAPNTTGDYHLQASSLAIDRGDNGAISLTDKDLDGNLRIFSRGKVDMGAYEFQGIGTSTLVISVVTGPWEANSTWDIGRVPQLGDNVIIDNSHIVTLSTSAIAKNLQYRGTGKLKFNSTTSKLELGF